MAALPVFRAPGGLEGLLGLPGAAYAMGLTEIWTAVGCVAGIVTAWIVLAWRLRDEAEKYNVATFTEYLAAKHTECGRMLRIISSMVIVFFFFFYVGAQFLGGGKTLYTLFGLKPWTGAIITAAVIIPYTVYGGFQSVVYTDVVQAILMIITLIVAPVVGVIYLINHHDLYASGITEALVKAGSSYTSLTGAARGFGLSSLWLHKTDHHPEESKERHQEIASAPARERRQADPTYHRA